MTDNTTHRYEVRGWRSGQHMSYSVVCPKCRKRHMLKRRRSVTLSAWAYDLRCPHFTFTVKSWAQSELDAMAAENG